MSTFFGPGPSSWADDDELGDVPARAELTRRELRERAGESDGATEQAGSDRRAPTASKDTSGRRRRTYPKWPMVAVIVCLLAIAGAGWGAVTAGVRLETPPPQVPELSAEQRAQVDLTEQALALAAGAQKVADDPAAHAQAFADGKADADSGSQWSDLASAAEAVAEMLGGRWTPWPDGVPEGSVEPDYSQPVPNAPDWQWVADGCHNLMAEIGKLLPEVGAAQAEALVSGAAQVAQAFNQLAGDKAAYTAASFAQDVGLDFSTETTPLTSMPPIGPVIDSASVQATDAALAAYDVAAALTKKDAREPVNERRGELEQWITRALATGIDDPRLGFYDIPDISADATAAEFIAWAEQVMAHQYLHLTSLVLDEQRALTLHAVLGCADRARQAGGEPLMIGLDQPSSD